MQLAIISCCKEEGTSNVNNYSIKEIQIEWQLRSIQNG